MNALRKSLGIIWMLLGPAAIFFLCWQAFIKFSSPTANINDYLQWGIIILVFVPIAIGMVIFGYYALQNEYHLDDE
jgi:hypothetical protein